MFGTFKTMMLASWIAAVLTVSPLVSALQCRQCCRSMTAALNERQTCTHHADGDVPLCCQGKTEAAQPVQEREPCDDCPRCASVRPVTAVVSQAFDWKLPTDFIAAILPPPVDARTVVLLGLNSVREMMVDLGTPPPRVLFCIWRK